MAKPFHGGKFFETVGPEKRKVIKMDKGISLHKRIENKLTEFCSRFAKTDKGVGMSVNILVREEDELFVAQCLELDIVATADSLNDVKRDMFDLIRTQVHYAFINDNLDHLYHPAPANVWEKFFQCKEGEERQIPIRRLQKTQPSKFVPSRIITNTCYLRRGLIYGR